MVRAGCSDWHCELGEVACGGDLQGAKLKLCMGDCEREGRRTTGIIFLCSVYCNSVYYSTVKKERVHARDVGTITVYVVQYRNWTVHNVRTSRSRCARKASCAPIHAD